jgi:formyltetrahydrofolate-dependent phosphoribosylglycinamide formyltransferase
VPPIRIASLVSGRGSNLQALLEACAAPDAPGRVVLVVSNRADAGALERARAAGLATAVTRADGQDADGLLGLLREHGIELVVLAGYLKRIPDLVVAAFRGRMINVHPALLPAFGGPGQYGHHVHAAVLAAGARLSGVTVHLVDEEYDHGTILAQWPVPVRPGDTADALAARVLAVEHRLLPAVVHAACRRLARGEPVRPMSAAADVFTATTRTPTDLTDALVDD